MDGGTDVHGGVRFPQQLHDPQRRVIPAKGLHSGAQLQPVGQDHVHDQAEGHAGKHGQAKLIVAGGIAPPQCRRHPRQQQKPAAIGEHEPLVEGDQIVQRTVQDIFRGGNGEIQPEEPDQVHHPVQLVPQVRAAPAAQLAKLHVVSPIFYVN